MTPQELKAMKMALEVMRNQGDVSVDEWIATEKAIKEALAEHAMREVQRLGQEIEQEPVAWLLTDKKINSLQVDDIYRLIDRLKHAHHTDLCVRINGQDEWFEADWLKHMVRATPPQRTWVNLTDEDRNDCLVEADPCECLATPEAQELMRCVEAKSRSKNQ